MQKHELEIGGRFWHIRTQECYVLLNRTKIKVDGVWVPGVIYKLNNGKIGEWFTRTEHNFRQRFRTTFLPEEEI